MDSNEGFYKYSTIVLLVILLLISGVWGISKYKDYKVNKESELFLQGYNQGVTDSVVKLYQDTEDCNVGSIFVGNITRELADVECIQKVIDANK